MLEAWHLTNERQLQVLLETVPQWLFKFPRTGLLSSGRLGAPANIVMPFNDTRTHINRISGSPAVCFDSVRHLIWPLPPV